ncbi:MAG: hypothetical protein FJ060_04685 [Cyanobacteria bacterium K_Offshore_0m_m2_072]|nr:hypothetical protein [Cyanobacteria bacterium K_Offshore_0m_m2_072]
MNSSPDQPQPAADAPDPYGLLGVSADASFEEVQQAKQARLVDVGDDPLARARVEAAYDAVLMGRLKERQQGKVSTAARSASVREQKTATPKASADAGVPSLPKLPSLPRPQGLPQLNLPSLSLEQRRDTWITAGAAGVLLALLLLVPAASPELLLSLATLGTVTMLQRRNRRFWPAVGWAFGLLVAGLLLGGLLGGALSQELPLGLPLSQAQVQSLPALVLLALGALLIA